jgi:hypothetical protein|tara:strand:- start:1994 stop:2170 length:177 start_codon:yes stop_codon:yes gene_type:complete
MSKEVVKNGVSGRGNLLVEHLLTIILWQAKITLLISFALSFEGEGIKGMRQIKLCSCR